MSDDALTDERIAALKASLSKWPGHQTTLGVLLSERDDQRARLALVEGDLKKLQEAVTKIPPWHLPEEIVHHQNGNIDVLRVSCAWWEEIQMRIGIAKFVMFRGTAVHDLAPVEV